MISGISIKNFKSVRSMPRLELLPFHVLVGPNGSGKSTFLEAIEFVRGCLKEGPRAAVASLAPDFRDLTFMRRGGEIVIELWLELDANRSLGDKPTVRYKLAIAQDSVLGIRVSEEILQQERPRKVKLLGKTASGRDFYRRETGTYQDVFVFGGDKLALAHVPPDVGRYPTANAVRDELMNGIRYMQLNSRAMRQPAPATSPTDLLLDGTNLARVVGRLARSKDEADQEALRRWTEHLRYALDDLESIDWAFRTADNAEYLVLHYSNGLECPNWLLSDGTLRMLALTLPAFLPVEPRIYMVEEPENGVHPKALQIILQALAAIPASQVFVATHSPIVVQEAGLEPLLCFSRNHSGTHLLRGSKHPALRNWNGTPDLASVFASRILG